jgi:hypothetical protein
MFGMRHRALIVSLLATLTLAWSNKASAEELKPPPQPIAQPVPVARPVPQAVVQPLDVDLDRLGSQLDWFAEEARRKRIATTLTGIGMASALIPTGIILLKRTDGVSQAVVIGMIVGGSAQLLSVLAGFIPTRMDAVHKQLRERVTTHADMNQTVEAVEIAWRGAAAAGRHRRLYVGGTLLSVGLMSLGTGLTFLIASEGIFGMSRKTQYTLGGIAMGTGIPVTTLGVHFLFEWSAEETAWEAYRKMKADGPAGPTTTPTVGVVPTPGGAIAFTTLAF